MLWLFRRYYVYVHHGNGRMDCWHWDGKRQRLLFRNNKPAHEQPPLSDEGVPYKGRVFRLEQGKPFFEVLFIPTINGRLKHVPD